MFRTSTTLILVFFITGLCVLACKEVTPGKTQETPNETVDFEQEKKAILETINDETKAAFNRDYQSWKEKWVHEAFVTKTYMNMADSSFSETLGWNEVDNFVKTFIEEHPEPDPIPTLVDDINVRLYENGAWVDFEQYDSLRGLKRETRLMEKIDGHWKIAGYTLQSMV